MGPCSLVQEMLLLGPWMEQTMTTLLPTSPYTSTTPSSEGSGTPSIVNISFQDKLYTVSNLKKNILGLNIIKLYVLEELKVN